MCCCGDHCYACCFPVCFVSSKRGCCGKHCWITYCLGHLCYLPALIYACQFVGEPDLGARTAQAPIIVNTAPVTQQPITIHQIQSTEYRNQGQYPSMPNGMGDQSFQQRPYPNPDAGFYRNDGAQFSQPMHYPNPVNDYRSLSPQPMANPYPGDQFGNPPPRPMSYSPQPMPYPNNGDQFGSPFPRPNSPEGRFHKPMQPPPYEKPIEDYHSRYLHPQTNDRDIAQNKNSKHSNYPEPDYY